MEPRPQGGPVPRAQRRVLRDFDSADRMQQLRAAAWAVIAGGMIGFAGSMKFGTAGFVVGWILGAALSYVVSMVLAGRVADAGASVYLSSGTSTPARREYSLGDALAAQGKLEPALAEFERCAAQFPDDPEPLVRMARLLRDQLRQPEPAAEMFRRALRIPALAPTTEWALARELTELFTHRLHDPARALPLLAQLIAQRAGAPVAEWARAERQRIKKEMQDGND